MNWKCIVFPDMFYHWNFKFMVFVRIEQKHRCAPQVPIMSFQNDRPTKKTLMLCHLSTRRAVFRVQILMLFHWNFKLMVIVRIEQKHHCAPQVPIMSFQNDRPTEKTLMLCHLGTRRAVFRVQILMLFHWYFELMVIVRIQQKHHCAPQVPIMSFQNDRPTKKDLDALPFKYPKGCFPRSNTNAVPLIF